MSLGTDNVIRSSGNTASAVINAALPLVNRASEKVNVFTGTLLNSGADEAQFFAGFTSASDSSEDLLSGTQSRALELFRDADTLASLEIAEAALNGEVPADEEEEQG